MKPKFINNKPIRLIELFGGIGSQAMALKRLGINFEHYRLVEFDKYPIASYNAIHGTNFTPIDITQIHGEDLGIIDTNKYCYLMTYSFPCQDLSIAGKQQGMGKDSGTRSGLLWEVERLINEVENLPQLLLMENVPMVHSAKNMPDFESWIKFLENKGYSNYWQDLNAKDYGVAQSRNRCFMVSILGDYSYNFPSPKRLDKIMKDYLEESVDEKYYICDGNDKLSTTNNIVEYKNNNRSTIIEEPRIIREPPLDRKGWHRNAKEVLNVNGLCRTINAQSNSLCTKIKEEPSCKIRKLTPKECYRLMGFDDESFERAEKVNSNTQLYKQAGNSIVVDVLVAIFKNLFCKG